MLDHYIKYHHIHDAVLTHMIRLTNGSHLKLASSYGGQTSSSQVLVDLFDYDVKNYHEIIPNAIVLNRTPSQESIRTVQ